MSELIPRLTGNHNTAGSQPLVSVVMSNLNKGKYIRAAIESVLTQSYQNLELIVVDNGSIDESLTIIEDFAKRDPKVHFTKEPHLGMPYALNTGIAKASGKFVALMDSDDLVREDRIEKQVACLQDYDGLSACYSEGWIMDINGVQTGRLYNRDFAELPSKYEGNIFHELIKYDFVIGASLMLPKQWTDKSKFDSSLEFGADWDFLVRMARELEFCYVPEPLYGYRTYSGNKVRSGDQRRRYHDYYRIYERWLRDFAELNNEDRKFMFMRLMDYGKARAGRLGMLRVVLAHPEASGLLLRRARSSIEYRVSKLVSQ